MPSESPLPVFPKYRLLGIWLNALAFTDILCVLKSAIGAKRKIVLANQNLHSVYICSEDPRVRQFFDQAAYTHADGTSLIAVGRLLGLPFRTEHRIGYMDLFPALIPHILEHDWRVFYLGARDEVLQRGISLLKEQHPDLKIAGHHGYFDRQQGSSENLEVIRKINDFRPNLIFVGMGMPTQELWIFDNQDALDADVILHCGALMDYIAGAIPTPPRWLGPIGLEWAFRLVTEPRRLWRRYLLEPIKLLTWLWKTRAK
ncbi:N-acetylglucosaminyldiphosphoundecaprenol N-acetyl-beta-D-mannosaminyltransferase [Bryocella elongata]|uniref:N-acetylglucosaminyldiphosphoundecaprenol N-acetyl-beta-D-mannosaminyltransferase n=1 Tax=Bryocella elongata TaxID=863522 RepID=A0A1H5UET6_9BACT|nr:WecB/TagA/CpsF family glycosyltransferase [Bryocella elongata]SEF73554.1 N-acetylglucosaminyldiphosphoundecaprenol N-acetyl-beta-D-mannosaminyltransferase [Bryocella elongata]